MLGTSAPTTGQGDSPLSHGLQLKTQPRAEPSSAKASSRGDARQAEHRSSINHHQIVTAPGSKPGPPSCESTIDTQPRRHSVQGHLIKLQLLVTMARERSRNPSDCSPSLRDWSIQLLFNDRIGVTKRPAG